MIIIGKNIHHGQLEIIRLARVGDFEDTMVRLSPRVYRITPNHLMETPKDVTYADIDKELMKNALRELRDGAQYLLDNFDDLRTIDS